MEQGLLPSNLLPTVDNAIQLCPTCHRAFNDILNPGFVFAPSDIHYFIDFERRDQRRRKRWARQKGEVPQRLCPTAAQYRSHQIKVGIIDEQTKGGLYARYMLRTYLTPGTGPFPGPVAWCGAPSAALRRAFIPLGGALRRMYPQNVKSSLVELQDLYDVTVTLDDLDTEDEKLVEDTEESSSLEANLTKDSAQQKGTSVQDQEDGGRGGSQPGVDREDRGRGKRASERGRGVDDEAGNSVCKRLGGLNPAMKPSTEPSRSVMKRKRRTSDSSVQPSPRSNHSYKLATPSLTEEFDEPSKAYKRSRKQNLNSQRPELVQLPWVWGPNGTINDAIEFFMTVT